MILLSTSEAQTVAVGQPILFDVVVMRSGCKEYHRGGSGSVRLNGCGRHRITMRANVGGGANTQAELAIAISGEPLPETTATASVFSTTAVFTVSSFTDVNVCRVNGERVSVINVGDQEVTVAAGATLEVMTI